MSNKDQNQDQNQVRQNDNTADTMNENESGQQTDQNQVAVSNKEGQESDHHNDAETVQHSDGEDNREESNKEGSTMNLALVGGVVGAGAGLLAKPEVGKKIVKSLGESELVRIAGREFKKTAQELLAGQAQESFKQMATGYIDKMSNSFSNLGSGNASKKNSEYDSAKYEEIKQENEELNNRLDRIESMLNKLASSK